MSKKPLITILVLLALGIAFYFFAPDSLKFWREDGTQSPIGNNNDVKNNEPLERITAKHQYKNGTHIIAGEINLPTPCHILTSEVRIAESYPEQVTIAFAYKSSAEMCAEVITPARFKVEFKAAEKASINATLNGKAVILNLIPAGPNEDLNDFELFIKG